MNLNRKIESNLNLKKNDKLLGKIKFNFRI